MWPPMFIGAADHDCAIDVDECVVESESREKRLGEMVGDEARHLLMMLYDDIEAAALAAAPRREAMISLCS